MASLIDAEDVKDRLAENAGLTIPASWTDGVVLGYAEAASAIVLLKAGLEEPPAAGTQLRLALDDLASRLAVLTIWGDINGSNPADRESNRRERDALLEEIEDLGGDEAGDASAGDPYVDYVDTLLTGDET